MKVLVVFAALATLATASLLGGKTISLQDDGTFIVNDIGKGVIISKPMAMLQNVPEDTLMSANGLELQQTIPDMTLLRGQIPWWMMIKKTPMVNMMHKTPNMFGMNGMIGMQNIPWWKWQMTPLGINNINNIPMMERQINPMAREHITPLMRLQDVTPMMRLQDMTPLVHSQDMTPMMHLQDMTPIMRSQDMTPFMQLQGMTPIIRLQDMTPMMRLQGITPIMRSQDMTPMMHLKDTTPLIHLEDMTPNDMFHSGRLMGINPNWPINSIGITNNDFTKKNAFWNMHMNNMNTLKARRLIENDLAL